MNTKLLNELRATIDSSKIKKADVLFAGAKLIVTDDPSRSHHEGDVVVLSPNASEISWLVEELAKVFVDELDYLTKYDFYPILGRTANYGIEKEKNIEQILHDMIDEAVRWQKRHFH